jgi:serine/threonine-protein kinase ULK4
LKSFNKNVKDKVFNEVKVVHELRHPNILGFFNWYETRNHYWIIFEYCCGGDLRTLLDKDQFVIEPVLRSFARDLVSALSYLHSNGTVFCDLKPGNILLNEYSNLKLCDFGLSQLLVNMVPGSEPSEQGRQGTPYYMAPELFDQNGVFSFSSDIYSMGVVLYELACGKTPFTDQSFNDLARNICNSKPKPLTNVSEGCNDFILSLLEKNPVKRPKWKEIMAHRWWEGVPFIEYDYPQEIHFENFAKEKGYTKEQPPVVAVTRNTQPRVTKDRERDDPPSSPTAGRPSDYSSLGQAASQNTESQILRLSLNIKNNIKREKGEYLDTMNDHQDVHLDKNMTVNMGATFQTATEPVEEQQPRVEDKKEDERKSKSSQAIKTQKSGISLEGEGRAEFSANDPADPNPRLAHLMEHITLASEKAVKSIVANPEIEQMEAFDYVSPTDGVTLLNDHELQGLEQSELENYLSQIYKSAASNAPSKDKLNLLHYLVSILQNSNNANLVFESLFMELFAKLLKGVKTKPFKVVLCTILGLCLRHATIVNESIPKLELPGLFIELLKDPSNTVRRRAMAALGEFLFYSSDQIDSSDQASMWEIPVSTVNLLNKILNSSTEDDILKHYAAKTVENIVCKSKAGGAADLFCQPEFIKSFLNLYRTSKNQGIRNSALVAISAICTLAPKFIKEVVSKIGVPNLVIQAPDSEKKVQQALLKLLTLHLMYGDREAMREVIENLGSLLPFLMGFLEHGSMALKGKTLLLFTMMCTEEPGLLADQGISKLFSLVDKLAANKNKNLKGIIREFLALLEDQLDRCLEIADRDFEGVIPASLEEEPDHEEGDGSGYEGIVEILALISAILTSACVHETILNDQRLERIFAIGRFYEPFVVRTSKAEQQVSEMVLLIIEQIISDQWLLCKAQALIVSEVLPLLGRGLESKVEACRYASIKWISDILQQLTIEDVEEESKNTIAIWIEKYVLPKSRQLVSEANPIGTAALKLLRAGLELNPGIREALFTFKVAEPVLACFQINHEKCNPNTIKVVTYLVDSDLLTLKSLADQTFFDKLFTLFHSINDIMQGEEIIELMNVYFRKLFRDTKLDLYSLDKAKQAKSSLIAFLGSKQDYIPQIHQQASILLTDSQGYPGDLLETILYVDTLLYSLDFPESQVVTSALVQQLLNILLSSPEEGVANLITHIVHIHIHFSSGRLLYRAEHRLGVKVIEKLKSMPTESAKHYLEVFEGVFSRTA